MGWCGRRTRALVVRLSDKPADEQQDAAGNNNGNIKDLDPWRSFNVWATEQVRWSDHSLALPETKIGCLTYLSGIVRSTSNLLSCSRHLSQRLSLTPLCGPSG